MTEQDYREKIKKLLALSESDNEHEAKSALLKAKKLMAEHKIAETDLENIGNKKVVHVKTEFDCSTRREAWMIVLSSIIGQNFCCQPYRIKGYNKQVATICFVGLEGDVDVCVEIFRYAVECIRSGIDYLRKESKDFTRDYRKRLCDGYGFGYTHGIKEAFKQQMEHDETGFGLVMTIPKEVSDETDAMKHEKFKSAAHEQMSARAFLQGNEDGKKFDPGTKLSGKTEQKMAIGGVWDGGFKITAEAGSN